MQSLRPVRYGLVTQQSKPTYKYFTTGRTMEEAKSKTIYYDAVIHLFTIYYKTHTILMR